MRSVVLWVALAIFAAPVAAEPTAATPPMGWNSWDSFGFTISEAQFRANAGVLAHLKGYGWRYAVIDEGWYMEDPFGENLQARKYVLDAHGLLAPARARFPSSADGKGFKSLAGWVHSQGLEFGLHIVRGIPKQAVHYNLPIAGSTFHAVDAADTSDTCPWDDGNYGVADNAAGQAYYDSMMRLYADWGLDFIKVDCIANHPYKASEIRQIAAAIKKTGRGIVLSISPGPTQMAHGAEVSGYAQMWRIGSDLWDGWTFVHQHPEDDFPNGVLYAFDGLAAWSSYAGPNHWPDADMLPFGSLSPHPGWGEPRETRLTHDEERSAFTLWAIARSPLILGSNLTSLDEFTLSLITNRDVLDVNQQARDSRPVTNLPHDFDGVRVWVASQLGHNTQLDAVVAVFNLDDQPRSFRATWAQLTGQTGPGARHSRELWTGGESSSEGVDVILPGHGCVIYRLEQVRGDRQYRRRVPVAAKKRCKLLARPAERLFHRCRPGERRWE